MRFSDRDEGAARRQRVVREPDEVLLLIEVPVVQDHAHGDHVGARQRVLQEITRRGRYARSGRGPGDPALRDRLDHRQIE